MVVAVSATQMAAILCLVFLPMIAAVGFMVGVAGGEHSLSSIFSGLIFATLGFGIFIGMFKMARTWEGPEDSH
jgi:hypothetical protein